MQRLDAGEHIGSCAGRGQLDKYWHGLKVGSKGKLVRGSCPCCCKVLSCMTCVRRGELDRSTASEGPASSSDDSSWHGKYDPPSLPTVPEAQATNNQLVGELLAAQGPFHPTQWWARQLRQVTPGLVYLSNKPEQRVPSVLQTRAGLSWHSCPRAPQLQVLLSSASVLECEAEQMERLSHGEQFAWFYWHFCFACGQEICYEDSPDIFVVRPLLGFKWRSVYHGSGHHGLPTRWALEPLPLEESGPGKPAFLQLYNFTEQRARIEVVESSQEPSEEASQ